MEHYTELVYYYTAIAITMDYYMMLACHYGALYSDSLLLSSTTWC